MREVALELKAMPAQVLEHHYSYESFGSWFLVFRYRGRPFRIVFDGKEQLCVVEESVTQKAPYRWERTIWQKNGESDLVPLADLIITVRGEGNSAK
jgi:hypothetical protein